MKQGYNNPIITYDEVVDALKSILECSLSSNCIDDFDYLNIKYESGAKNTIDKEEEKILYDALKALEKTLDSSSKLIRMNLEQDLSQNQDNIFKIATEYLIGQEKRKLSTNSNLIEHLRNESLNIEVLYQPSQEEDDDQTALEVLDNIDTNTVFSDFEKRVIADFPGFFKEEIELANKEDNFAGLFDTKEIINSTSHEYIAPENIEVKNNNLELSEIKRAMNKAKIIGREDLYYKLKEKYDEISK